MVDLREASMIEQYFGLDSKKCGYFFGSVIGTAVIITVIYCSIYGFDHWKGEVKTGAQLMTAAAVAPVDRAYQDTGVAGQYICPRHGPAGCPNFDAAGSPHCPTCGTTMQFNSSALSGNISLAAGGG